MSRSLSALRPVAIQSTGKIKSGVIYAIHDPRDGIGRYVGMDSNWPHRKWEHLSKLDWGIHGNKHLQNAFNSAKLAGVEWEWRILQECLPGTLGICEQEWIARYRAKYGRKLCNRTLGGEGGEIWTQQAKDERPAREAPKWSDEQRKAAQELAKAQWKDPTYQARHLGKPAEAMG
jgi:hypothetical protein